MGTYADDIINGDVDQYTGEWIGEGQGFPRNNHSSNNSRPDNIVVKDKTTVKYRSVDHDSINTKYGKGWREQY